MSKQTMPWFRMYSDFLNDPKMISISFEDQRHFIGVLALKGEGTLDHACAPELLTRIVAQRLWIDHAIIGEVKKRLVAAGLIDENWQPLAWEKRQARSDSSTERVRAHRQKAKKARKDDETLHERSGNNDETLQERSSNGLEEKRGEESREDKPLTNTDVLVVASEADDLDAAASNARLKPDRPACPHQEILALYHELLPTSPLIRDWTPARAGHLRMRWSEDVRRQSLGWWRRFFAYIAESAFLTGKVSGANRKPFTPGLDWICKAENFAKIREGRFHDAETA